MKKLVQIIVASSMFMALGAQAEMMDARQAADTAVKERQVHYVCSNKKSVKVTYGFNKQNLPTFAQAYLNGKTRFMPINLAQSNNVNTNFGDQNNFSLMSLGSDLTLANVQRSSVNIQDPASNILFKLCDAKSVKRIKG